jgi:Kef-type K+ transport system membrane component KefB
LILQLIKASEALREVVNERGVAGLFAGLAPSLVLSVYPALQHSIYDRFLCFVVLWEILFDLFLCLYSLKRWYLRRYAKSKEEQQLPALWAFVFGIISNLTALSITYPLIYVK